MFLFEVWTRRMERVLRGERGFRQKCLYWHWARIDYSRVCKSSIVEKYYVHVHVHVPERYAGSNTEELHDPMSTLNSKGWTKMNENVEDVDGCFEVDPGRHGSLNTIFKMHIDANFLSRSTIWHVHVHVIVLQCLLFIFFIFFFLFLFLLAPRDNKKWKVISKG